MREIATHAIPFYFNPILSAEHMWGPYVIHEFWITSKVTASWSKP